MVLSQIVTSVHVSAGSWPAMNPGTCFRYFDNETHQYQTAIVVDSQLCLAWIFQIHPEPKVGEAIEASDLSVFPTPRATLLEPIGSEEDFEGLIKAFPSRIRGYFDHRKRPQVNIKPSRNDNDEILQTPPLPPLPPSAPKAKKKIKVVHPSVLPENASEVKLARMIAFVKELKELLNKYDF